ncbi:MAG TPA: TPM domain-containing protein [Thermoanaerobaculia bacterium]|nr:TPM domain-containing protein [Thermoanaerobaculia bacterium]
MKSLLRPADHERIVAAIAEAERKSSGQIRVHLHHRAVRDPIAAAKTVFERLGMTKTAEKNGALVFVAPKSRNFAILGDSGIHARCGDDFWREAADAMSEQFRRGDFAGGIVATVGKLGDALAAHFPRGEESTNELPDEIDER